MKQAKQQIGNLWEATWINTKTATKTEWFWYRDYLASLAKKAIPNSFEFASAKNRIAWINYNRLGLKMH